jgi:hypothetical protein
MPQEEIIATDRSNKAHGLYWWVSRLLAGAVGLVLVVASILKATDMELFLEQIRQYGIISHYALVTLGAWGLIALEFTLGFALVVFYRPRLILPITAMLLLIFIGVMGWAWLTDATTECGCYGRWVRRTPGEGVLENLIFLAAIVPAWAVHRHSEAPKRLLKTWIVAAACLIGFSLPVIFGFSISRIIQPPSKTAELELGRLQVQGLKNVDLSHGLYLIVLMETDCPYCQEAMSELNMLADTPDMPLLIGLIPKGNELRIKFEDEYQPAFPIEQISDDAFWRLLGDGYIPRIFLVRDGRILKVWDRKVPEETSIRAAEDIEGSVIHRGE